MLFLRVFVGVPFFGVIITARLLLLGVAGVLITKIGAFFTGLEVLFLGDGVFTLFAGVALTGLVLILFAPDFFGLGDLGSLGVLEGNLFGDFTLGVWAVFCGEFDCDLVFCGDLNRLLRDLGSFGDLEGDLFLDVTLGVLAGF